MEKISKSLKGISELVPVIVAIAVAGEIMRNISKKEVLYKNNYGQR